jgi:hypothetical protein
MRKSGDWKTRALTAKSFADKGVREIRQTEGGRKIKEKFHQKRGEAKKI